MRVMFVTSAYPEAPDDARGIFIHRIARGLVRRGVEVTVVAPGTPTAPARADLDGVEIRRAMYWARRRQGIAVGLGGIVPNLRAHPLRVIQVPPLIGALTIRARALAPRFDLVHAHWVYPAGIAGLVAARRSALPFVVTSHGGDLNLAGRSRVLRLISGKIAHTADACVGVSEDLAEHFISLGVGQDRVWVIPYGVDPLPETTLDDEVPDPAWNQLRSAQGLRVIYVGSLIPRKSVETLLHAHQELERRGRRVASVILGSGSQRARLEQLVRDLALQSVWFIGDQPPSLVPRWMSGCDVLVLPSHSEGRPNVVLEAMAAGLPVVATDIPGTRELVRAGETGLLYPVADFKALADCLQRLDEDEGARREMGGRGRARIEREGLTVSGIAERYLSLYRTVVERARVSRRVTP